MKASHTAVVEVVPGFLDVHQRASGRVSASIKGSLHARGVILSLSMVGASAGNKYSLTALLSASRVARASRRWADMA